MNHDVSFSPVPRDEFDSRITSNEKLWRVPDLIGFPYLKILSGTTIIIILSFYCINNAYPQGQHAGLISSRSSGGIVRDDLTHQKICNNGTFTPGSNANTNLVVARRNILHNRESLQFEGFPRISLYNDFDVSRMDGKVLITWRSAYDARIDHFEVVRYENTSEKPAIIAIIPSKGGSSMNTYEFLDQPGNLSDCHYQLRATDKKGNQIVIEEKPIDVDDRLQIYPDVTEDEVMLTNFSSIGKPATVKVINCQGKVVRKSVVPAGSPAHVINLVDLDDGDYSITIESNKTSISSVVTKE